MSVADKILAVDDLPDESVKYVTLSVETSESDGADIMAYLERIRPGYFLTEFDPEQSVAILTAQPDYVADIRRAAATALDIAPWNVQARATEAGVDLDVFAPVALDGRYDELARLLTHFSNHGLPCEEVVVTPERHVTGFVLLAEG